MIRLLAGAAILIGLAGCGTGNGAADVVKALATDPAAVCLKVTSPWGSSLYDRNWGCEAAPARVVTP
jgi:hypothetical protein